MKFRDYLFKLLVGFSVSVLNVSFLPTIESDYVRIVFSLATLGIGILVAYEGILFQKERKSILLSLKKDSLIKSKEQKE